MLDGEVAFLIGDKVKTARTGDFFMVPRNMRRAFRMDSETARFLKGYTPASLNVCIVEMAMRATERVLPRRATIWSQTCIEFTRADRIGNQNRPLEEK